MYESYVNTGQGHSNQESLKELATLGRVASSSMLVGGEHSLSMQVGSSSVNQLAQTSMNERGSKSLASHTPSKMVKSTAGLKQWLSYERKAMAVATTEGSRRPPLTERSALSQFNPNDEHGGCLAGCLTSVGLRPKPVFMPPTPGEDVCGTCQNNKPLLQMQFCEHKVSI